MSNKCDLIFCTGELKFLLAGRMKALQETILNLCSKHLSIVIAQQGNICPGNRITKVCLPKDCRESLKASHPAQSQFCNVCLTEPNEVAKEGHLQGCTR